MKTLGSLFSGIGGFESGFESAGFITRWQCEIDPHARAVLKRHWPDVPCYEDVTTMNGAMVPPVDIITFGSPCQDLSVAGRRGGLAGERSGLFHEAVRLIAEMREATNGRYPTLAVWENVVGAFSSNAGRDFAAVLDSLAGIGAVAIGHRVLDAQYFGVPQRRRRIFLVADFGGHRAAEILALAESGGRHPQTSRTPGQDPATRATAGVGAVGLDSIAGTLGTKGNGGGGRTTDLDSAGAYVLGDTIAKPLGAKEQGYRNDLDNTTFVLSSGIASTLGAAATYDRGDGSDNLVVAPVDFQNVTSQANRTRREFGDPANTLHQSGQSVVFQQNQRDELRLVGGDGQTAGSLTAEPGMHNQNFVAQPLAFAQNQQGHVYTSDAVGALSTNSNASGRNTAKALIGTGIRRLTPLECERLMGTPDHWTAFGADGKPIADSHRYRMLGNSVVVPVIAWLARNVRAAFPQEEAA